MHLVDEVESVVENGEHGGTQRWQLTIIHLVSAKESCKFRMQDLAHDCARSLFVFMVGESYIGC